MTKLRLGVLLSGSGTNLQAILDASEAGSLDAEVVVVISNREDARGLERARRAGVPAIHVDRAAFNTSAEYNHSIADELHRYGAEYVVMAGYMRLLGKEVLDAYPMRVLNLHPALLPAFPGASSIHDAFDYGAKVTGVTVHFADEHFDRGPILAQQAVPIEESDTLDALEARIHAVEHRIYPAAIQAIAQGRVSIDGRRVKIAPAS